MESENLALFSGTDSALSWISLINLVNQIKSHQKMNWIKILFYFIFLIILLNQNTLSLSLSLYIYSTLKYYKY